MKKIIFKHTDQICDFFNLFEIKDKDLLKNLDHLLKIDFDKEKALEENNYDKASQLRIKEIEKIHDIILKLNKKKILNKNTFTVELLPHEISMGDAT